MIRKSAPTYQVTLHLAGDYQTAKSSLRRQTFEEGLCVTLEEEEFVYTAGAEVGVKVGLVQYPRFVKPVEEIRQRAEKVLLLLMDDLCQNSGLMVTPEETVWFTRRPEDVKEAK
jgi:hypothetical protein